MQGQILSVAVTSNQGLILGDDGRRYTFTPRNWRDSSVKAVTGMRVEFMGEGAFAANVYAIREAFNATVQRPYQTVSPTSFVPGVPANTQQKARTTQFNPSPPPMPERPPPAAPTSRRIAATPEARAEARQIRKTVGLLCFLGAIGVFIAHCYIGTRMTAGTVLFSLFLLITLPIQYVLYPIYFVVAIVVLCMGDNRINRSAHAIHLLREHGLFPNKMCKDECPHTTRIKHRSAA